MANYKILVKCSSCEAVISICNCSRGFIGLTCNEKKRAMRHLISLTRITISGYCPECREKLNVIIEKDNLDTLMAM